MNDRFYILDEMGEPVKTDLMTWARWNENREGKRVAHDRFGDIRVSTVFLGLDHNWGGGVPILWETMVFGGKMHHEQDRCSGSREQAEAMHARMVKRVLETENL